MSETSTPKNAYVTTRTADKGLVVSTIETVPDDTVPALPNMVEVAQPVSDSEQSASGKRYNRCVYGGLALLTMTAGGAFTYAMIDSTNARHEWSVRQAALHESLNDDFRKDGFSEAGNYGFRSPAIDVSLVDERQPQQAQFNLRLGSCTLKGVEVTFTPIGNGGLEATEYKVPIEPGADQSFTIARENAEQISELPGYADCFND